MIGYGYFQNLDNKIREVRSLKWASEHTQNCKENKWENRDKWPHMN